MPHMIILRGLPGSGKTTWAKEWCAEHPYYKRICRDDLRAMLDDGGYSFENELFIKRAQEALIVTACYAGKGIVIDDTNINTEHVMHLMTLARDLGMGVRLHDLDTPLRECIERDALRQKPVGEVRIKEMHEKLVIARKIGLN